jgi:hypothetical protein
MARFYDRLRREQDGISPELQEKLGGVTVIDGTNLSDYLYANEAKGEWDLVNDFFNIAPPFEKFFVECKAPAKLLTKKGFIPWPTHLPREWGVLFLATDLTKLNQHDRDLLAGVNQETPEASRWLLQAILFAETPYTPNGQYNGKIREQFSWWFPVLPDGSQPTSTPRQRLIKIQYVVNESLGLIGVNEPKFTPSKDNPARGMLEMNDDMLNLVNITNVDSTNRFWYPDAAAVPLFEAPSDEGWESLKTTPTDCFIKVMSLREDIPSMKPGWQLHYTTIEEKYWLPLLQPCLMTICFLHVKNITMERMEPPKPLVKKAMKRYGEPLCTYHVLKIQPFKKVLETEGHVAQTGIRHALSICRAHFHHYGEQFGKGLLFGKISGTFYIPSHIRGSIERGMVDKSYRLETTAK